MNGNTHIIKTLEYSELFTDNPKVSEDYIRGIDKRWLIESIVYMISADRFDSFSSNAKKGLLVMFQDYLTKPEVGRLFKKIDDLQNDYQGVYLTLINHRALYSLLRKVLLMSNEESGKGECFESYLLLLKATLSENTVEMLREKESFEIKNDLSPDIRDALVVMQQDVLNLDRFGDNKQELKKSQLLKFLMLCEFGKKYKEVGMAIRNVVDYCGFKSEYEYMILANLPFEIYHDKNGFGEGLFYIRRSDFKDSYGKRIWEKYVAYVSNKCLDVWDMKKLQTILRDEELLDNTCFRKYPVLKMSEDEYLIASQTYYFHLFYDGLWWDVKNELSKNAVLELLTREFSEKSLFYGFLSHMQGDRRIRLYNDSCFSEQQSAPDMGIMTRRHLFLFEYKDMRVDRKVADGRDMSLIRSFVDDRLNRSKGTKGGNKGLPQLICNMEDFFEGKEPWDKTGRKGKVKVYPILVVNSRFIGVRGINYILQHKLQQRILQSAVLRRHVSEIGKLLVVDMDMIMLVAARANGDFSRFYRAYYSYQSHCSKSRDSIARYDSFRQYIMNKWAKEKSVRNTRLFIKGYKSIVKNMLSGFRI